MPTYRTIIHGRNFIFEVEGKRQRHGFYQTVFVEAADVAEAELNAIRIVKESSDLKDLVKNDHADPPMLYLDEIAEIASSEAPSLQAQGRSLYSEAN
jgi:hypothetical protein